MLQDFTDDWLANIGSGEGLLSPGNKPWPELMLTKFYGTIWVTKSQCVNHGIADTYDIVHD